MTETETQPMKILIAVDDSAESRQAVSLAFKYFGSGADYSIISVGDRPPIFVGGYGAAAMPTATDLEQQLDAAHDASQHAVLSAQDELPEKAELDVEVGHAGTLICEYATEHSSEIIVVGSHDRNFWERIFDPSVRRYLVDHAPCPVLVVR